jgi:hypothetical protein
VIGHKVVNGAADTDTIYTPGARRFRQVRLCVYDGPINLRDFDIYFARGGQQDVHTRAIIHGGDCTRVVDLKGGYRDISRIRLRYGQLARGMGRPTVRVSAR